MSGYLEAVWFKRGKVVHSIMPVMNLVCNDDMSDINEIEVFDGEKWHSCEENGFEADDFIIRLGWI